jgi:UDP-N-acetylmuramoyl-L-alanyl-D-glutamate--2,6-diaminopimelate ligase
MVRGEILEATPTSSRIRITTPASELELTVPMPGEFNVQNALAAVAVGFGFDLSIAKIVSGIEGVRGVPGRMEAIDRGQPFQVIVDYAHTPDALKRVFETLKPTVKGRLIHVGGATGDRDTTKRPILGALAGQYADIAIVTDEDPGSEDPMEIINAVAAGVRRSKRATGQGHLRSGSATGDHSSEVKEAGRDKRPIEGKNFFIVPNRRDAIAKAIDLAKKDDLVLITGKGHEEIMAVKDGFVPFSDRKIVSELLESH